MEHKEAAPEVATPTVDPQDPTSPKNVITEMDTGCESPETPESGNNYDPSLLPLGQLSDTPTEPASGAKRPWEKTPATAGSEVSTTP